LNLSIDKKDSNIIYDYKLKKITLKELKNKKLPEFVNKKERITPLMLAARWGDKDLIKLLLSKNKNTINKINKKGLSAIFYSVKNGDNEINDYLIKNGASTNTFASKKMNLAMFALKYKANNLAYRLIKDIKSIKNKNDIRSLVYEDEDHWTIMEYASRYGSYRILKHLFQQKVKYPKSIDEDSYSPLMLAVKHSGPKVVKILLKNKAKANEALKYKGALMFAIEKNKYEVAKLLIKHKAGAFIRDYRLWNSLFYAVRYSDVKMFKLILKEIEFDKNPKTGKDDNLFLIASLKKGNVEILKEINKLKIIDVNAKNIIGETALIVAVKNNHIKNIKYLLSIGANPSIKDINGLNAYHFAETRGYKNALIELNKYNITISSK